MNGMVTISSSSLVARIALMGAELQSVTDRQGREYMTDADPEYWTGHAPILFPIIGELAGGTYRLDGKDYPMKRHGFARRSRFDVVDHEESRVRLRLVDTAASREIYPFAFQLDLDFALTGMQLATMATVTNPGNEPLPFSFGFHPAWAWPLPGGGEKLGHAIVFASEEPEPVKRLNDHGLVSYEQPSPLAGRTLALDPSLFESDALIWDGLASRAVTYRSPDGPHIHVAFPDSPRLGIWQVPGAHYICIEPWAGIADPAGYDGDFRDKPGIVSLAPGAERRFRMDAVVSSG